VWNASAAGCSAYQSPLPVALDPLAAIDYRLSGNIFETPLRGLILIGSHGHDMETLLRNIRLSIRQFYRQPGNHSSRHPPLGLAIGANTTVFSFVDDLLLHPFPFRDSDQLVEIYSLRGGQPARISMPELLDIREQVSALDSIAGRTAGFGGYNFSGGGKPEEWKTVLITGNLFEVLGVPLSIGNTWPELANRSRDNRVIISHGAWQTSFAGSRDVIGRNIVLDHAARYRIDGPSWRCANSSTRKPFIG
jgi:putative ABC transport system permease protein